MADDSEVWFLRSLADRLGYAVVPKAARQVFTVQHMINDENFTEIQMVSYREHLLATLAASFGRALLDDRAFTVSGNSRSIRLELQVIKPPLVEQTPAGSALP